MTENNSALNKLTKLLVILTMGLLILTGFLLFATLHYAGESQKYASKSEFYASESERHLQNVTKLNEEIIGWYKNPEPILTNWTNHGKLSYITILNYENWKESKELFPYFTGTLSEEATEITVYLWNSGRAPARYLTINLNFQIDGYDNQNPAYPFPIKMYSIITPNDYLGYVEFLNGEYINATMHGGGVVLANSDGRIKYLPEIDNATNTIQFPDNVQLGNIKPNDIIAFSIKLFAMHGDVQGEMTIHIKDLDNTELQKIYIPLKTFN